MTDDLHAEIQQLREDIAAATTDRNRLREALARTINALAREQDAYRGVSQRREELAAEVRAAEAAARDYRQLLLDAEAYGEIPVERCNQRTDLDTRHADVIDDDQPLDYAPTGIVVVTPTD